MNIEEILNGIAIRDENACRWFISEYNDMVFRICMSFLNNQHDAEEVCQDVFIKAIYQIASYQKSAQVQTWLYRIAVNESLNHIRKHKKNRLFSMLGLSNYNDIVQLQNETLLQVPSNEAKLIEAENQKILMQCLNSLPEKQRIAFTLNKIDELTYTQIAEMMSTSLSSVESLIHRAKKNIQSKILSIKKS